MALLKSMTEMANIAGTIFPGTIVPNQLELTRLHQIILACRDWPFGSWSSRSERRANHEADRIGVAFYPHRPSKDRGFAGSSRCRDKKGRKFWTLQYQHLRKDRRVGRQGFSQRY